MTICLTGLHVQRALGAISIDYLKQLVEMRRSSGREQKYGVKHLAK